MPELPETETIARDLDSAISGRTITGVKIRKSDVIREVTPRALARRLTGARIDRCWRRAKLVVMDLGTGDRLVVQPRFTGAWILDDGKLEEGALKYSTLAATLDDGRALHYCDVRRLGTVALMEPARFTEYSGGLGIEPLDPAFTHTHLSAVLGNSSQAVKRVLMDQRKIAGIGNIYANEALWRARINPARKSGAVSAKSAIRLRDAIVGVLEEAIQARGTSFRDYRDPSGNKGTFVDRLAAYGRAGLPCLACGRPMTGTHEIDGRATVYCARCQRS